MRWNAPDECPDDVELIRSVESYLGQPLSEARQQQLAISVSVLGSAGGFSAKLRFKGANGLEERYLEHPDCRKLAQAAALLAALAIDPERVNARQLAIEAPAAAVEAEPTPPALLPPAAAQGQVSVERARDAPKPSATREATLTAATQLRLGAFAFAGGGALPSAGPGLGADLAVRRRHLELGVVGRYWLPRVQRVAGVPDASIELSLLAVGARACGLPWLGDWSLRGCAGADLADIWGSGEGVSNQRTRHAVLPALSASLSLSYGQHRLAPFAGLEASWALARPPFGVRLNGEDYEVFRASALSGTVLFGLTYAL